MEVIKEITQWNVEYRQPNHTYLVSGDKVLAYKPWHGSEIRSTGGKIDKRGRKFEKFPYIAEDWPEVEIPNSDNSIKITGSNGNVYTVVLGEQPSCDCTGFKFRGNCKHIGVANEQNKAA